MANEITFGFIHSQTLYATVYEPNGDTRTARALMTEKETDTGYYIKDDGSIQTGDFVIIDNGTRNVGQGQYRPDAQVINPEDCKATGFSTHDAASVWAVGTRTLSAGTRDTEIDAILALIEASGAGDVAAIKIAAERLTAEKAAFIDAAISGCYHGTPPTTLEITNAILAMTGVTAGGTWTFAQAMKVIIAWAGGKWQDSATADSFDILDPDDGSIIATVTPKETTPQKVVVFP